jgi:hypothetical protein
VVRRYGYGDPDDDFVKHIFTATAHEYLMFLQMRVVSIGEKFMKYLKPEELHEVEILKTYLPSVIEKK